MTKSDTLSLAASHVAEGRKIIFAFERAMPIGFVRRRWAASTGTPTPEEIIDDQPLVVVREATYEEWAANRPACFLPVPPKERCERAGLHFYEMICE